MDITLYSILNFYVILITIAGFILPALFIYFYSSYKNHYALIICTVLFAFIAFSVREHMIVLLPFMLPVLFAGAIGSYLRRTEEEFWHSMGYVILAEMFGIMLGIMVIYFSYGRQDITQLIAQGFNDVYLNISPNDEASNLTLNFMTQLLMISPQGAIPEFSQIAAMSIAEKLDVIIPQIKASMANLLPSTIMGYGIISGVSSWFVSSVMLAKRKRNGKTLIAIKKYQPHPKFSTWKMPRWMTNVLMFLLLTSLIIQFASIDTLTNVASALQSVALTIMAIQGLSVLNWWLKKKKIHNIANTVICILSVVILSFILPWIGLIDIVFNFRTMDKKRGIIKLRMEEIKKQIDKQMQDMDDEKNIQDEQDENESQDNKEDDDDESEGKK